jgi:hypothetical protein
MLLGKQMNIAIVIDIESNVIIIPKVLTLGMQSPITVFIVDMFSLDLILLIPFKSGLTMLMC